MTAAPAPPRAKAEAPSIREEEMAPPNIVVITTHDSGRHFGCYGVPTVNTPHIDRLAAEGVRFDGMLAASPICSPSRGALLSGCYPLANGLVGLAGGSWNWEMHDARRHLSHRLRDAGYTTAMFGLQHETVRLERMGFDDRSEHGATGPGGRPRPASEVADAAAAFFRERGRGGKPFYAQVGFHETHTPYAFAGCLPDDERGAWTPPYARCHGWPAWASVLRRFGGDRAFARRHLAELQGSLREADRGVGRVLDGLREAGLEENTLVLFNTDHGPELPGAKWTLYEAGLGVAFILRWPAGGVAGGRACGWQLCNVDFVPTLFELIGLPAPTDVQGVSFARACREAVGRAPSPRPVAFANWVDGLNFSARTDRFKLIRNLVPVDSTGRACDPHELYDLERDPLELVNVAAEPCYAGDFEAMRNHLDGWLRDLGDPQTDGPVEGADHGAMLTDYRRRYEAKHAAH